ncbi:hypothetical protein THOM_1358 [Trachipleistophora hominis]|uniref:Uncharacterized protein n=1 Tax=Trachipleistophora hominis TaxID=72359 RepID=L7JXD4_TRAHO|nr:hypothetical protein THOM_1358 [Trachipleistophora hominis]
MLLLVKNIPRYTSYRLLFDALTKDLCVSKKYIKLAYKPGKAVGYLRIRNKEEFLVELRDNDKPIVHEDGKSNNILVKDTEQVGENAEENKIKTMSDVEVGNMDNDKLNNICDIVSKGLDSANDALNDKSLENIAKNGFNKNEELSSVQSRDVGESLNDKLDMKIFEFLCRKEIKLGKKF